MTKRLKDLIKKNPEPAKGTNVNPSQLGQYSAKYQVSESSLDQYLSSRGIDPTSLSTNTKISHAKSSDFLKWKKDHQFESIMLDKSHKSPVQQKQQKLDKSKEAHKVVHTEGDPCWTGYTKVGMKSKNGRQVPNCMPSKDVPKASGYKKEGNQMSQLTPEEVSQAAVDKFHLKLDKLVHSTFGKSKTEKGMKKEEVVAEDIFADNKAATQTVMAPGEVSERKRQLSKSARIVKALYKNRNMKEDTHDWEKEDKSVKTYGKKPKFDKADKEESQGEKKPQSAAVLSGGKTLTGTPRDTVEIDPMMRNRPGQPDITKKDDKKKDDKDGKKQEKK